MKTKLFLILIASLLFNRSYSQSYDLDINQVRARIINDGSLFFDEQGVGLFEVPKGSGKT